MQNLKQVIERNLKLTTCYLTDLCRRSKNNLSLFLKNAILLNFIKIELFSIENHKKSNIECSIFKFIPNSLNLVVQSILNVLDSFISSLVWYFLKKMRIGCTLLQKTQLWILKLDLTNFIDILYNASLPTTLKLKKGFLLSNAIDYITHLITTGRLVLWRKQQPLYEN